MRLAPSAAFLGWSCAIAWAGGCVEPFGGAEPNPAVDEVCGCFTTADVANLEDDCRERLGHALSEDGDEALRIAYLEHFDRSGCGEASCPEVVSVCLDVEGVCIEAGSEDACASSHFCCGSSEPGSRAGCCSGGSKNTCCEACGTCSEVLDDFRARVGAIRESAECTDGSALIGVTLGDDERLLPCIESGELWGDLRRCVVKQLSEGGPSPGRCRDACGCAELQVEPQGCVGCLETHCGAELGACESDAP